MNSLEILQALCHLSVRYAGVYPTDRLPRVWTRSTAIITARTITINLANIAFYIDEQEQERVSIATDYRPWTPDSFYVFDGTLPRIDGTLRRCKECFLLNFYRAF